MSAEGHPVVAPASSASGSIHSYAPSSSTRHHHSIKTVVTSPPWARDEPPTPSERDPPQTLFSAHESTQPSEPRSSDVLSSRSSITEVAGPSRWWTFTKFRPQDPLQQPLAKTATRQSSSAPARDRSSSLAWLTMAYRQRQSEEDPSDPREANTVSSMDEHMPPRPPELHVDLPPPPTSPYTLAHNITPGWDTPWTSRHPASINGRGAHSYHPADEHAEHDAHNDDEKLSTWETRRKRFRAYILYNPYVPLLFRFLNIVLTTAALVMAIQIRAEEKRHGIMGAVGSSPTLVIIFASMTLVHVMIAIWLEYFGRPLGLWRTSAKLSYTLLEVVFICLWSAALALSFDNYFTSDIPCASPSDISWYSQLPRPPSLDSNVGGEICNEQLALICLVGVGLTMYCSNLIINLFRIFEKVKYRPTSVY